jgi:hypothetical protein
LTYQTEAFDFLRTTVLWPSRPLTILLVEITSSYFHHLVSALFFFLQGTARCFSCHILVLSDSYKIFFRIYVFPFEDKSGRVFHCKFFCTVSFINLAKTSYNYLQPRFGFALFKQPLPSSRLA